MRIPSFVQAVTALGRATSTVCSVRQEAVIEGVITPYMLKRSARRKRISLIIDDRGLRVCAPLRTAQSRIDALIAEHAPWVSRQLAHWDARRPLEMAWRHGATLMVLGAPVRLACDSSVLKPERAGGDLLLPLARNEEPALVRTYAVQWLKRAAAAVFDERTAHFAAAIGVRPPTIRLSSARTRWGSCHPDGRISLNWRLIHVPLTQLDYVVVHELAHLRELNHSPRFWREVEHILPDFRQRRSALRADAHRYLAA